MATPAAVLSIMVKAQGAQAAIGQLNGVDAAARKAGGGVDALEKKSAKGRAAFDKVGKGAGIVAGGVALLGAAAVNSAAKYEQSMNTLQAVSGQTGAEMKKVSKLAIKLGADVRLPGTSAQDAAEAMTEMIKAGVSLKDTMAGVRDVLVLSAAAGVSNAEAAEIASNALNAFKLEGKDVKMVTDQLANTANASSVEIKDVADSFKMAAAVFSGFQAPTLGAKGAMTELNVAIGLLGNAGIKGSDAGTSLKQMLLQLTGPAQKTKNLMRDLYLQTGGSTEAQRLFTLSLEGTTKEIREGASNQLEKLQGSAKGAGDIAYTAAGKMRSLPEIIDQVSRATKGMTDEQKNATITQIFGADATRSVIALMNAGPAAFGKMEAAVTKQGAAQALADAKMKGFKGSMEALKSTLETLAINVGTKLLPSLTALVKRLSAIAGALSPTAWLVLIGVVGSLAAAVFTINAAMKVYAAATAGATAAQWLFNAAVSANPIVLAIVAIAALGAAMVVAYKKSETFRNIVDAIGRALRSALINTISSVLGAFSTFLGAIGRVAGALGADGLAKKAKEGQRAIDELRGRLEGIPPKKDVAVNVKINLSGAATKIPGLGSFDGTGDGVGRAIGGVVSAGVKAGVKRASEGAANLIPGLGSVIPKSGASAGNLMGANASLGPFAAVGAQFGLHVSSGKRNGSGGSYHNSGQAVDLANGQGPDAAKLSAFKALKSRYGSRLAELIYTPGGVGIKNGQPFRYTGAVAADHFDHVHVAFTGGGTALGQAGNRGDGLGRFKGDGPGVDSERGWLNSAWTKVAPLFGKSASATPLPSLFKHIRFSGATPFVGVATDPGKGNESAELLWPRWLWQSSKGQKKLDERTKLQLFIHEMAHRFQSADQTKAEWMSEGGAEAFARIMMGRNFGGAIRNGADPYNAFVTKVMKEKGIGWVTGGQFANATAGAGMPGHGQPRLSGVNLAIDAARKAGFKGTDLVNMVAIAGRESSYSPSAHNYDPPIDDSWGLWQINVLPNANPKYKSWNLSDPYVNAKAAHQLFAGAGLRPWNHKGGPLGGTNVPAARAAVLASQGAGGTSAGGGGGGGASNAASGAASAAAKVNPLDQKIANADLAIQTANTAPGRIGSRSVSRGFQQVQALTAKRKLIGARIQSIRKALKGNLSKPKRLALTQELTQRLQEHAQLGTDIQALKTPAAAGGDGGSIGGIGAGEGDGGDPNQALIDAINAKAEQDARLAEEQRRATEEHTAALNAAKDELKRQTDFATAVQQTEASQLKKYLADVVSGQIGGYGVAPRSYTPSGNGVGYAY